MGVRKPVNKEGADLLNKTKTRRSRGFLLPKRKVSSEEFLVPSKSIIRSIRQPVLETEKEIESKFEEVPKKVVPQTKPEQSKPGKTSKPIKENSSLLYSSCVKFFSGFTSSHLIRKKFGSQRILQELQRNTQENEAYGGFFGKQDNWTVSAVTEMNLLDPHRQFFTYQPECLLGVGGQGCVFLGKFLDIETEKDKSYAFKIRARTKSAINSGTSSSPGRRRSPNFRVVEGRLKEQELFDTSRGVPLDDSNGSKLNFIDDLQQEALHREAVAAFRVYSQSQMHPKPVLYGYSAKMDYEVFVMDIMDFTLNEFMRGTNWKTRMDCLNEVWRIVKESFDNCHQSGIVHYDIKPENLGIRIINGKLETGLLDFGISKSQGYSLDLYCKRTTIYRPPGTIANMSPRSHVWKPMSWMDDFLSSFFTMYNYGTTEGKSSFEKMDKVKKYKSTISTEDRKLMTPESVAIHCLRYPPWARFPYGTNHALKKKQNETIVKEEVSLAMIKIHSLASPKTLEDIVSILLNIDGFLDDTMDAKGIAEEAERSEFSSKAAQTLQGVFTRNLNKLSIWWLDFAEEVRRLVDEFWVATPEEKRQSSYEATVKLINANLPNHEDIDFLIENSTCGRKIIEATF